MGMGQITPAKELSGGHYQAAGGPPNIAGMIVNGIDSTSDIAGRGRERLVKLGDEAGRAMLGLAVRLGKEREDEKIDMAERRIRDLDVQVRQTGYKDENGIKRPAIQTLRGMQAENAGVLYDRAMLMGSQQIVEDLGLSDDQIRRLQTRTHKLRRDTVAHLTEWGVLQGVGYHIESAKYNFSEDLNSATDGFVSNLELNEDSIGALMSSGFSSDQVTKMRLDATNELIGGLIDRIVERRNDFVQTMLDRSLGSVSGENADAYADGELQKVGIKLIRQLASKGKYDAASALVEASDRIGFSSADKDFANGEIDKIRYQNSIRIKREIGLTYDAAEREAYKSGVSLGDYAEQLKNWAEDKNLQAVDPDRAERYARCSFAIDDALKRQASLEKIRQEKLANGEVLTPDDYNASFDPEVYRRISDPKYVEDKVYRALDLIRLMKCDKESSQAVAKAQFEAFQTLAEVEAYQLMDRGKIAALRKEIDPVMNEQAVNAMRIWYSRWGVSPQFVTKGGSVRDSDITNQPDELTLSRRNDYESDTPQARMDKRKFFELSSELLHHLQNAPDKYNDVAAMHALLDRLEIDGLESMQDDTIDTTQEVLSVLNTVERGVQDMKFYENLSRDTSDLKEAPVPKRVKKPQEEKVEKAPENRQSLRPRPPSFMPKEKPQPKKEYRYRPKPPTGW